MTKFLLLGKPILGWDLWKNDQVLTTGNTPILSEDLGKIQAKPVEK